MTGLYHSPRGIPDFQAEGVARAYLRSLQGHCSNLICWDTGTGKSHLAMILAAMLFTDDKIDMTLVVCESDKLEEWVDDFRKFTDLSTKLYHGLPVAKRQAMLADPPQVIVSTYETIRNDAAHGRDNAPKALDAGFLTESLRGKRVLVLYDEMSKLKNRTSALYRHHEYLLSSLRKACPTPVTGLTATPVERSPENAFNIGRLLMPGFLTVTQFDEDYVLTRDVYDNPSTFKNIGAGHHREPWIEKTLHDHLSPIMQIKHKSDPDVRDFFPEQVEEFSYVVQGDKEREFYEACEEVLDEYVESIHDVEIQAAMEMATFGVLRQIACHPQSLLHSNGKLAKEIVRQVGAEGISKVPSAKLDRLLHYLEPLVRGQGAQAVVFTFFGQSVLPIIEAALRDKGYSVVTNHGSMSRAARDESRRSFTEGRSQIFLSSDAGSRGINLRTAEYVVNYELPLTHANYIQRINRIHRLDSEHPLVTAQSFILANTVEEGIVGLNQRRNEWCDLLLPDDEDGGGHLSAADRKFMRRIARDMAVERKKKPNRAGLPWAA